MAMAVAMIMAIAFMEAMVIAVVLGLGVFWAKAKCVSKTSCDGFHGFLGSVCGWVVRTKKIMVWDTSVSKPWFGMLFTKRA